MIGAVFSFLVTPALVSLIVSTWTTRFFEAKRARRDNLTKLFEAVRDDVRRAGDVAIDYFAAPIDTRTVLQETKILSADRELRSAIPHLLNEIGPLECEREVATAQASYEGLVAELTAGTFQASEGEVDKAHIQRLVYAVAKMRTALSRLRDAQLRAIIEHDPIAVHWDKARDYAVANNPFRDIQQPPH